MNFARNLYAFNKMTMLTETLSQYLSRRLILEGGLAGHMPTPVDFKDFTGDDLIELVVSLFSGNIEHMKEKLDGTNLNAYRNLDGETVFIRNQTDLNSDKGGMSLEELSARYFGKPDVAENFIKSAKVIEEVFSIVPVKFFNPEDGVKVVVNCECISAGKTNVMIYDSDRVAFHGTSTYRIENGRWRLESTEEGIPNQIAKAAEGIDRTKPRPDLIVKDAQEGGKTAGKFAREITRLFSKEGLRTSATIDLWKKTRFANLCPEWIDPEDVYQRWFYGDKSVNLNSLKKKYSEHMSELVELDKKEHKRLVSEVMEPIDSLFMQIGNELIASLDGFTNTLDDGIPEQLKKDLDELAKDIRSTGTEDDIQKLERQMQRLESVGNRLNSAEGIVFTYKGKVMKLTGSFSALNQIMGMRRFSR